MSFGERVLGSSRAFVRLQLEKKPVMIPVMKTIEEAPTESSYHSSTPSSEYGSIGNLEHPETPYGTAPATPMNSTPTTPFPFNPWVERWRWMGTSVGSWTPMFGEVNWPHGTHVFFCLANFEQSRVARHKSSRTLRCQRDIFVSRSAIILQRATQEFTDG